LDADREVKVIKTKPPPLLINEQDIYERTTDHVLAQCYYCHYEYVPVPANQYSMFVVYNCGCHKEPMFTRDDKIGVIGVILVILASVASAIIWR
jgi:hypothetical protein